MRISESRYGNFVPSSSNWEVDPDTGTQAIVIRANQLDTHHQYAVIIEIPPFHNPDIQVMLS